MHTNTRQIVAFTITELLVVIAIIAILLGILLSALTGTKERAEEVQSLANLRSLGQMLEIHQNENGGEYPYYDPSSPINQFPEFPDATTSNSDPWFMRDHWPCLQTVKDVAPWSEHYTTWLSPTAQVDERGPWWRRAGDVSVWRPPSYHYSNSFLGRPEVWSDTPPPRSDTAMRHTGSSVRYPSLKVIMWDDERAYLRPEPSPDDLTPALFVDGSASLRDDRDATSVVNNPYNTDIHVYNDTAMGIRGRDF